MTSIHEGNSGSPASAEAPQAPAVAGRCAALEQRRDELEAVIAAARLGYCRIDLATRAVYANPQFKGEFGWPPDAQLDWHRLQMHVNLPDRARFTEALEVSMATGGDLELLVEAQCSDGSTAWIALRGRVINDGDRNRTLIVTSRDVTAERQTAAHEES